MCLGQIQKYQLIPVPTHIKKPLYPRKCQANLNLSRYLNGKITTVCHVSRVVNVRPPQHQQQHHMLRRLMKIVIILFVSISRQDDSIFDGWSMKESG